MDLDLTEDQLLVQKAARDFAQREIAPKAAELDKTGRWPTEIVAGMAEIVKAAVASTGAAGPKDMGKVIGAAMAQVKGKAEGSTVSRLVKAALGG